MPRLALILLAALALTSAGASAESGLLFYLSAEKGTVADISAAGAPEPTFDSDVTKIPDGVRGPGLQCGAFQQLAWRAPGHIYAQRGTLSFHWRSRYAVGPTEFPIFRVAYADHSSHDMVWLRIDYNGHGFDAFVTDTGLARTRVSTTMQPFAKPGEWIHLAFSWDEIRGVRLYVNGALAAKKDTVASYDAGLDQFGPHSRIISPHRVASADSFIRGGDIDELRIYDHMLPDEAIGALTLNEAVAAPRQTQGGPKSDAFADPRRRAAWWRRYGWERADVPPPYYSEAALTVRKVEIHEAYDLKRWYWKALDGIRETTWPGVYNRSRLPGRHDYFTLPDWDCYVESGKVITFTMPAEPWNHVEIFGAAWGKMEWLRPEKGGSGDERGPERARSTNSEQAGPSSGDVFLFDRVEGREKTIHPLEKAFSGGKIRFTNVEQEEPIGELVAYHVASGREAAGQRMLKFRLAESELAALADQSSLRSLERFIHDRFPVDERATLIARPMDPVGVDGGSSSSRTTTPMSPATLALSATSEAPATPQGRPRGTPLQSDGVVLSDAVAARSSDRPAWLPLVHVLIPNTWDALGEGLDGIAIDLPALDARPTHGDVFPLNLRVKDPLWPMRDMFDFTFSVKPREAKTLWLDLRDRLLPPGKGLWLTVASAGSDFSEASLSGAELRLIFKSRDAARLEHERDRFTQVRDCFAMLVEANPNSPKLNLWVRFETDLRDLLRVNPDHTLARQYAAVSSMKAPRPAFVQPEPPAGTPLWAFRQVELLGRIKTFALWYIAHRQVGYGDFGGGISDDVDLTTLWPGIALMGCEPEKIRLSLRSLLDAAFRNGLFTNGLSTIQADQLHSYEEGINCLGQVLLLEHGSPRQLERAMATARGVEGITGINSSGHRHIRTSYYSGTKMATEEPWGAANPASYLVLHPGLLLVDFNGSPQPKACLLDLADGLLAHRRVDREGRAVIPRGIRFADDQGFDVPGVHPTPWHLFWGGWKWTGDRRYLDPLLDNGAAWLLEVNANVLDALDLRQTWASRLVPEKPRANAYPNPYRWQYARPVVPREDLLAWQLTGDKARLERIYGDQIEACDLLEYINTEGSLWIDRVGVPTAELQYTRLGGVALTRGDLYPGHAVSWRFAAPASDQSVAILVPDATPKALTVIAHNLEETPVRSEMTGWSVDPGRWELTQGIDSDGDDAADRSLVTREVTFERSRGLELVFPPHATTVVKLKLKTRGTPYWSRPDLGIDRKDVEYRDGEFHVRVHSLGSVDTPASSLGFRLRDGRVVATVPIPALKPPTDLFPKIVDLILPIPSEVPPEGGIVEIDPDYRLEEITRQNNIVVF